MIKKEIKMPINIKMLQVLLLRLPNNHPKRQEIEQDLSKRLAGLKGEQSLDYFFSFLPPKDYYIFHNLRLPNRMNSHYFQIDILLLTTSFILIIEVKNISGTLTFDPIFDQVIWNNPATGIEKAIQDPLRQVTHQKFQLSEWLKHKKYPELPIEPIVVYTNQSTILKIKSHKKDYIRKVIRSGKLLETIEIFQQSYPHPVLSIKEMKKLSNQLMKHHTPQKLDVLSKYELSPEDILPGILCENCLSLFMQYQRGKWYCPHCFHISTDAHIKALEDYSLLFESHITNHQCKNFLKLPTEAITYHLLRSMNFPCIGTKKGRKYSLPPLDLD